MFEHKQHRSRWKLYQAVLAWCRTVSSVLVTVFLAAAHFNRHELAAAHFLVFSFSHLFSFPAYSISCFDCNSWNDPGCADPFRSYAIGIVNCSMRAKPEHINVTEPKLCRKIVQRGKTFHSQLDLDSICR